MLSKVNSIATTGLHCERITVETDISRWLSAFIVVWLWDTAIQEAKERVRSAIKNTNLKFPNNRITINLAPADIRKKWPIFDLPIAVWIMLSSGQIFIWESFLRETIFIWELALDWSLWHVSWVLPISAFAKEVWFKRIILPIYDAQEAALVEGIEVLWIKNLSELIMFNEWKIKITPTKFSYDFHEQDVYLDSLDFKHIKGQDYVKRALEISAAWGHNILMWCL